MQTCSSILTKARITEARLRNDTAKILGVYYSLHPEKRQVHSDQRKNGTFDERVAYAEAAAALTEWEKQTFAASQKDRVLTNFFMTTDRWEASVSGKRPFPSEQLASFSRGLEENLGLMAEIEIQAERLNAIVARLDQLSGKN